MNSCKTSRCFPAILAAAWCGSSLLNAQTDPAPKLELGTQVKPRSYAIGLQIDPGQPAFSGTTRIELDLAAARRTIWLHGRKLKVKSASIESASGKQNAKVFAVRDLLGFDFPKPVPAGPATLRVEFSGVVDGNASAGIFQMKEGGEDYVFTQFEPIDARAAFPCFDEPGFKVPWQLTLHVRKDLAAVANTPVEAETPEPGGRKAIRFAVSKPLPSYLVAFGVGPFEFVDAGKAGRNQVPLRIVVPRGKSAEAKYAAEVTAPILDVLENYFGTPYPYEKLDKLAIPLTFGFGAMENAGLITYAGNILLANPERDTIARQRDYASVAAHEMAHQWFGNLVTTAWWDDIWLNEAFATWMATKVISTWKPEWADGVDAMAGKLGAMGTDSLGTARRVRQPIETQNDVSNAFDSITYQKGAAVIRMFEAWTGEEAFQQGVRAYVKNYAFRNATSGDFLDSISLAGKKDVTRAFSTFLNQPGVPLIRIERKCQGTPKLILEQERALPAGSRAARNSTWQVPVCIRYESGGKEQTECRLLSEKRAEWELPAGAACPGWVQANDDEDGYYRVLYSGGLLQDLIEKGRLSPREKIGLIGSVSAAVRAGVMPAAEALPLAERFSNDPQRQVVNFATSIAGFAGGHLLEAGLRPNYARFVSKVFGARARQLGWLAKPGESDEQRLLRSDVVPFAAVDGKDAALLAEARSIARQWLANPASVASETASMVLPAAAADGDAEYFDLLVAALRRTKNRQDRGRILNALASFEDPALVRRSIRLMLEKDFDLREAARLIFEPASNPRLHALPLEFLRENFNAVAAKMPTGSSFDFGSVLPQTGGGYCDAAGRAEVEKFFTPLSARFSGAPRNLSQTLESIDLCIALKAAQQASVSEFLKRY